MRLRSLRYFAVLAEELHYGHAARRLCITQPPLSASIKALEDELGVQLFVRTSRDVKLTPAGEVYQTEVRTILESIDRAARLAKSVEQGAQGRLTIGFAASLVYRGVVDIVRSYSVCFPRVEVELVEIPQSEMLEKLQQGQVDIGFTNTPSIPAGLAAASLAEDEFGVCMPAGHRLANETDVAMDDLAGEFFVMPDREMGPQNYQTISAIFHRAGVYPRLVHKTRGWHTSMALVSAGAGIALLPLSMAKAGMSGVRFVPLKGPKTYAMAKLVWRSADADPLIASFREFAIAILENQDDTMHAAPRKAG